MPDSSSSGRAVSGSLPSGRRDVGTSGVRSLRDLGCVGATGDGAGPWWESRSHHRRWTNPPAVTGVDGLGPQVGEDGGPGLGSGAHGLGAPVSMSSRGGMCSLTQPATQPMAEATGLGQGGDVGPGPGHGAPGPRTLADGLRQIRDVLTQTRTRPEQRRILSRSRHRVLTHDRSPRSTEPDIERNQPLESMRHAAGRRTALGVGGTVQRYQDSPGVGFLDPLPDRADGGA